MSEQPTAAPAAPQSAETPVAPLIAVAVAATITAFALIRVSAGSASAWLGMLLGVGVALAGGLVLGRWWPGRAGAETSPDVGPVADDASPGAAQDAGADAYAYAADAVSALVDEEHIVGEAASPQPDADLDADLDTDSDVDQPTHASSQGHQFITPDMLINDDHPTVAMHIPAAHPVAIDDKPESEALAAKDEVIRSLESIVKENRDRWSDFDAEREQLKRRISDLEAELRVATDLIEHGTDDAQDSLVAPQVLSQL